MARWLRSVAQWLSRGPLRTIAVARHVRLDLGFTYRFVGGTELAGLSGTTLSGPAGSLAVKFGEF